MKPSKLRCLIHGLSLVAILGAPRALSAQAGPTGMASPNALTPKTTEATPEASEPSETSVSSGPADEPEPEADSVVPPSPARGGRPLQNVQDELRRVEAERASASNFWPWLSVGVGLGAAVGSAAYGFGYAIDCDRECSTPNWVSLVVVAGAAVAALSMIWLVRTDESIRELDSRRYRLERDLERLSISSRTPTPARGGGLVTLHF